MALPYEQLESWTSDAYHKRKTLFIRQQVIPLPRQTHNQSIGKSITPQQTFYSGHSPILTHTYLPVRTFTPANPPIPTRPLIHPSHSGIPSQNKLSKYRISCFGSPELPIPYTGNTQYNAIQYKILHSHTLPRTRVTSLILFHPLYTWLPKRTLTIKFPTIEYLTIASPAGRSKSRAKNQGGVGRSIEFE